MFNIIKIKCSFYFCVFVCLDLGLKKEDKVHCSRTMGDRAQDFLALRTQELFCRLSSSVTANLGSISARGDFVCMGCLGVCVLAGNWRRMAADR
jgi:hypothetical protein